MASDSQKDVSDINDFLWDNEMVALIGNFKYLSR